jgi:hypothetical protein
MRIIVENPGAVPQTKLRVFTYGSINSTVMTTNLALTNNLPQDVSVTNIDGYNLLVDAPVMVFQMGACNIQAHTVTPATSLQGGRLDIGGQNMAPFYNTVNPIGAGIGYGVDSTAVSFFAGNVVIPAAGKGMTTWNSTRFTCPGVRKLYLTAVATWPAVDFSDGGRPRIIIGLGTGLGQYSDSAGFAPNAHAAIGYYSNTLPLPATLTSLEIRYYSGQIAPIQAFLIAQPDWNLDPADGTGLLPLIDGSTTYIGYRIIVDFTIITWQIKHPNTGRWISVHRFAASASNALFTDDGFTAFAMTELINPYTVGTQKSVQLKHFSLQQGQYGIMTNPSRIDELVSTMLGDGVATEQFLFSLTCKSMQGIFNGAPNRQNAFLSQISITSRAGVTVPMATFGVISFYSVQSSQLTEGAPVFFSDTCPVQVATVTAYTTGSWFARRLLKTITLNDSNRINTTDFNNNPNNCDWILGPLDCILVTYTVPSAAYIFQMKLLFQTGV